MDVSHIGTPLSLGQQLRQARERVNATVEQVARELKLTESIIHKIEADDIDKNPAPTFMRGYIRSYARLVNIADNVVTEAFTTLGLSTLSIPPSVEAGDETTQNTTCASPSTSKTLLATILVAILVPTAYLLWSINVKANAKHYFTLAKAPTPPLKQPIMPKPSQTLPSNATMAAALPEAGPKL